MNSYMRLPNQGPITLKKKKTNPLKSNLKAHEICSQLLVMVRKKHGLQFTKHLMNAKYIQNTMHTEVIK